MVESFGVQAMNTVRFVSNGAELNAALAAATGGETILLRAGDYSNISVYKERYSAEVVVRSADEANPATLQGVVLNQVSNLTFDNVEVTYRPGAVVQPWAGAFRVYESENITIKNSEFRGSVDGNFGNDGTGLQFLGAKNVVIESNSFHDLFGAGSFGDITNLRVANNHVYDMRSEGFMFAENTNVLVEDNRFDQFRTSPTNGIGVQGVVEHPGILQFLTNGSDKPQQNIVIRGNISIQSSPEGHPVGGIFMRDENGNLPYQNVLIENNFIYTRDLDTITVGHGNGVTIRNNTVLAVPGSDGTASILVWDRSANVDVVNNVTSGIVGISGARTVEGNVIAQWQDANRDGYYADLFVNPFNVTSVTDLAPLPDGPAANKGAIGIFADAIQEPLFIASAGADGSNLNYTLDLSIASLDIGTALSRDAVVTWSVDGRTIGRGSELRHTFAEGGEYVLTAVIDDGGVRRTLEKTVDVRGPVLLDVNFNAGAVDLSDSSRDLAWTSPALVAGRDGQAARFTASGSQIVVDDAHALSGLDQLELSFSLNSLASRSASVVSLHGSFSSEFRNGEFGFSFNLQSGTSHWLGVGSYGISDGNWHDVRFTYNGTTGIAQLVVDNNLLKSVSGLIGGLAETTAGRDLIVGGVWGRNYEGLLDNLRISGNLTDSMTTEPQQIVPINSTNLLRGSAIDDSLVGSGTTRFYQGGAGADTFCVLADRCSSSLTMLDMSFDQLDVMHLANFAPGRFADADDGNALAVSDGGRSIRLDSYADLAELTSSWNANGATASQVGVNDLHLVVDHEGSARSIIIKNAWQAYSEALQAYDADRAAEHARNTAPDAWRNDAGLRDIAGRNVGETLIGTESAEHIVGLAGDDSISGRGGNDILVGGSGNDTLFGGAGSDTFVFSARDLNGHSQDRLLDLTFSQGDRIALENYSFTQGLQRPGSPYLIETMQQFVAFTELEAVDVKSVRGTNNIIVSFDEAGVGQQDIVLRDMYAAFVTAGGQLI